MQRKRKDFPGIAEMRESARQTIRDWGWDEKYYRDEQPHKACMQTPRGDWKLLGYGIYQNADWAWSRYVSYRCRRCGCMIQVTQVFVEGSEEVWPVKVLEVNP